MKPLAVRKMTAYLKSKLQKKDRLYKVKILLGE